MKLPEPKVGLVINYSYLWHREAQKGRAEGIKDRPCLIIGMKEAVDGTDVLVVPITHSPPGEEGNIEIPAAVKSRLGLSDQRSWIVTSETNRFTWEQSPDLRPVSRNRPDKFDFGIISENLIRKVQAEIRKFALEKNLALTKRDEEPEID